MIGTLKTLILWLKSPFLYDIVDTERNFLSFCSRIPAKEIKNYGDLKSGIQAHFQISIFSRGHKTTPCYVGPKHF